MQFLSLVLTENAKFLKPEMKLTKNCTLSWGVASLCSGLGIGVPRLGMAGCTPFFCEEVGMFNLVLSIVIVVSSIWVYLDATRNDIGKIEAEKGFFNLHAGGWALVTLLLWIVGFPAYLIKRQSLIEKAYDHPADEVSGKWLKVAGLTVVGLLIIVGQLGQVDLSQMPKIKAPEAINTLLSSGKSEKISCSNEDVKRLVLEVTDEEVSKQLIEPYVNEKARKIEAELKDTEIWDKYFAEIVVPFLESASSDQQEIYLMTGGGILPNLPVEYFMEFAKVSPTAASIIEQINQDIKNSEFTLNAIRILKNEPDLKKVTCAADLQLPNNDEHPIKYTAQLTEDGQIYVEVSGL